MKSWMLIIFLWDGRGMTVSSIPGFANGDDCRLAASQLTAPHHLIKINVQCVYGPARQSIF